MYVIVIENELIWGNITNTPTYKNIQKYTQTPTYKNIKKYTKTEKNSKCLCSLHHFSHKLFIINFKQTI